MAEAITMRIGVRKGDPECGDSFDAWAGREDELRELMSAAHAEDTANLRRVMGFLPYEDAEKVLSKDRVKLMLAIIDNAGSYPFDMEAIKDLLGTKSMNNAKATPNGLLRVGLISEGRDFNGNPVLNLTEAGRDMLDYYEEDPVIFLSNVRG